MTTAIKSLNLDLIVTGYFEALEFCTIDNSDYWEDRPISEGDYLGYSQDLIDTVDKFCARFYADNETLLDDLDNDQAVLVGQDLYFTAQGHGVGFWEGNKDYPHSKAFDQWITDNGVYLDQEYVGDDGYLYSI